MASAPQSIQPPIDLQPGQTLINLLTSDVKVKASSGSSKHAKGILNGDLETAWTSENPTPNANPSLSICTLTFKLPPHLSEVPLSSLHSLALTFAGGFSAPTANLLYLTPETQGEKKWRNVSISDVFPYDVNSKQFFKLDTVTDRAQDKITSLQLQLYGSTDEYARVTLYQVQVYAISST